MSRRPRVVSALSRTEHIEHPRSMEGLRPPCPNRTKHDLCASLCDFASSLRHYIQCFLLRLTVGVLDDEYIPHDLVASCLGSGCVAEGPGAQGAIVRSVIVSAAYQSA